MVFAVSVLGGGQEGRRSLTGTKVCLFSLLP
jgi:hypothetical protein